MVTYEALRPLTSTSPDGQTQSIAPGEVVAGFELWPLRNQIAALNVHMVRERLDGSEQRPLSERANETQLREARERLIAAASAKQSAVVQKAASVDEAPEADPILRCGACDYSTHSAQGLKTHKARKHKV